MFGLALVGQALPHQLLQGQLALGMAHHQYQLAVKGQLAQFEHPHSRGCL